MNVIFLHGFCETKEMWKHFEDDLSLDYNVFCLDLPGFGDFHFDVYDLSIAEIAQIVQNEINNLQLDHYVLIGHSLGGYVALELAKQFPQKIKGLVMFHSTAFADTPGRVEKRNDVINFLEKHGSAKFVQSFIPQLFITELRETCKANINKLVEKGSEINKNVLIAYTKAMQTRNDNRRLLNELGFPIHFIVGKKDSSISLEDSIKQIQTPKISSSLIIENCGHVGMFEQSKITLKSIKSYLSTIN